MMRQRQQSSLLLIGSIIIIIIACHHLPLFLFLLLPANDSNDPSSFLLFYSSVANALSSSVPSPSKQQQQQHQREKNRHGRRVCWTAVPPTSNPKSKLNKDLIEQIQSSDDNHLLSLHKVDDGRIWFHSSQTPSITIGSSIDNDNDNNNNISSSSSISSQLSNLYNARSIRLVWMEINITNLECRQVDTQLLLEKIRQLFCQNRTKIEMLNLFNQAWIRDAGNANISSLLFFNNNNNISNSSKTTTTTFSLTIQKWDNFVYKDWWDRTDVCNMVADILRKEILVGWVRVPKSSNNNPTLKLNILLHECKLTLELVTFVRRINNKLTGELPKPGFKRIESFMICKSANIQVGETILDPMCGCGTFLIEAATVLCPNNNATHYVGVDISKSQLLKANENYHHVACGASSTSSNIINIELRYGDARRLHFINDNSIDKIITCPPFGRQFELTSKNLYTELLQEWSRILKVNTGRMVLVIDTGNNLNNLIKAVKETTLNNKNKNDEDDDDEFSSSSSLQIDFIRKPFRLGKIQATVVIVTKTAITNNNNNNNNGVIVNTAQTPSQQQQQQQQRNNNPVLPKEQRPSSSSSSSSSSFTMMDKFDWEKDNGGGGDRTDRAHWAQMRAKVLGSLIPYSTSIRNADGKM